MEHLKILREYPELEEEDVRAMIYLYAFKDIVKVTTRVKNDDNRERD